MKYKNNQFSHDMPAKVGVLITNLGTPNAPTAKALKPYLKEFLSDPRVVEFPRLLWWLILNGIILNIRPRRSAHAYKTVWTDDGSPLALHTRAQAKALKEKMHAEFGDGVVVEWAMRYGDPSMSSVLQSMQDQGVRRLIVLPLYPQYSAATNGSTFDAIAKDFTSRRWLPELRFINQYHDFEPYLDAVANKIRRHWDEHGRPDKLVFSYHGVPLRYLHNGDPYHCYCLKTSRLVADKLGLNEDDYLSTFQSRFGREEWLRPYTDETMKQLPGEGVKRLHVVCPGFSADCLETIEEIGEENRDYFIAAGGELFDYIPALNSDDEHVEALFKLVQNSMYGWDLNEQQNLQKCMDRYSQCPHNKQGKM